MDNEMRNWYQLSFLDDIPCIRVYYNNTWICINSIKQCPYNDKDICTVDNLDGLFPLSNLNKDG